jgi:DNA modification methylase
MHRPKSEDKKPEIPPTMRDLKITYRPTGSLEPYSRNPRTHSKKQIRQIADSIREFGFTNPILIESDGGIIAGHGRLEAAKLLGMETVPTIRLEDLTEAQIRAYIIADNKLAENAGWDENLLAVELQSLSELDLNFELTLTGFDMPEIDILISNIEMPGTEPDELDPDNEIPEVGEDTSPITREGDLWIIGKHRLLCGDSTNPATYDRLLEGERAQMIFADPPYNVPIDGHVCGLGSVKHAEFAMASGEMSEAEFASFLSTVFKHLAKNAVDGAIHFICMDWRHAGEVIAAGKTAYSALKNLCIWAKTNGGMGSLYRSQHELVFVFKSGNGPHINNVELGKHGRYRTNVWTYAGINSFGKSREEELAMHPTVKPVALVADAILDCSRRGGIILDPFAGSGTTLVAAERCGRRGLGIELDPHYCDVIIRRMAKVAGIEAIHAASGKIFSDLENERSGDAPGEADPDEEAR